MKFLIITVLSIPESVDAAKRCAESAARFGIETEIFPAFTPADDPVGEMKRRGWSIAGFENNRYSRFLPCISCFLSHANCWKRCVEENTAYGVAEHDAIFVRTLPDLSRQTGVINLGHPSFGSFRVPPIGIGPIKSKAFVPGAHALWIHPTAAARLLEKAPLQGCPADVFIHTKRFPGMIQEAYPWPVECHESFSTIQGPAGITAKHKPVRII